MGQDLVQRPLEQSRMGQDGNAPGLADKGDTVVDAAAVIRHVGWTPAIEELIKDRLDVREIAFDHELAGNMGPADGAALLQRRFDGAAVDIITKRPAAVDDFQGPVEAPFLELGAVSLQPSSAVSMPYPRIWTSSPSHSELISIAGMTRTPGAKEWLPS
mgnify:CR=1 FL=1